MHAKIEEFREEKWLGIDILLLDNILAKYDLGRGKQESGYIG